MKSKSSLNVLGIVMAALAAGACAGSAGPASPETADLAIIGGVDVASPKLDAVGLLQIDWGDGNKSVLCTGTLITPSVVLTAKHCNKLSAPEAHVNDVPRVYFAIGNDGASPRRTVKARRALDADLDEGGLMGSDVAFYSLAEAVTDVTPLPVAQIPLSAGDVGASFVAIGYGVQDAAGKSGKRTMGNITLSLLEGNAWKTAYGTFEAYRAHIEEMSGTPLTPEELVKAQRRYESPLLSGYEAFFGAKDGDVQPCTGDSGGPLLRKVGDKITIFGVASWGPQKFRHSRLCARGVVYATFGPSAADLIAQAPCDAEPVEGRCDGTTVVRCLTAAEGGPRVTKTRCDELDLACGIGADGRAGCREPATP